MKENKEKFSDGAKQSVGLLINSLIDVGTDMGSEVLKEYTTNVVSDLTVDTVSSLIPGIGGAISAYRRIRTEKNLKRLIYHIQEHNEKLLENLYKQTEANRKKIDELLQFILEIAIEEYQEDKIEYMVNGYINLTRHKDISSDFVMHYYDVLKQLRMVDISVLRLYYINRYFYKSTKEKETFQDVMERHGMTQEQYNSVRETLRRIGLLEIELKDNLSDNIDKLEDGINQLVGYIDHINRGRKTRAPKISKLKIKQKQRENYQLSKFGKDFYDFFGTL